MAIEFWSLLVTAISGSLLFAMLYLQRRSTTIAATGRPMPTAAERRKVLDHVGTQIAEANETDVFQLVLEAVTTLGFDAASLLDRLEDTPVISVGDWRCVAPTNAMRANDLVLTAGPTEMIITTWRSPSQQSIFSASSIEPTTALLVIGWSRTVISDGLADDLAVLMSYLSEAVKREAEVAR